ncbi:MAG: hypothetical protein LC659_09700, partial [Myxococcales bacterium]|nr:hypothetical protein [Myxococcales bacterium]
VVIAPSRPTRNAPSTDRVPPIAAASSPAKTGVSRGTIFLVAGLVLAVAAAVVVILMFVIR